MRSLNGIAFPHQARWTDRDSWQPVAQTLDRTVSGNFVRHEQSLHGGRPITVAFMQPECWATWDERQVFLDMAQLPNQQYLFVWERFQAVVVFRFSDAPAVDLQGINTANGEYTDDPTASHYVGQIKLITVE